MDWSTFVDLKRFFFDVGLVGCPLQMYPSQTKIWEGGTNLTDCVFEAFLNVLWPKSGTLTVESPSQTKIWEGGTEDEIRISNEALFQ